MAEPIYFYFDFSSPYGYLTSERIEAIARELGREVVWKPIMLGATFKATGMGPLTQVPLKGDYSRHDMDRSARQHAIPYKLPDPFPFPSIAACRAVYWAQEAYPERATALIHALFRKPWQENVSIATPDQVIAVASDCGFDAEEVAAALQDQAVKDRLRREVDDSIAAGICGSPFMVVDGEPFWGNDRLEMMRDWVRSGGW
ncbi:MAG: 2-hydroxychromene-2-carboxylate isomerase [Rhodospirillales bacterium]